MNNVSLPFDPDETCICSHGRASHGVAFDVREIPWKRVTCNGGSGWCQCYPYGRFVSWSEFFGDARPYVPAEVRRWDDPERYPTGKVIKAGYSDRAVVMDDYEYARREFELRCLRKVQDAALRERRR